MLLRCVIPLLLVLSSHAAKPTAVDKQGPILCEGGLGEQCGGVSGAGDVWENSENGAICCAKGYICQYKTMYYSECVALPMDELPKRKLDDADTAAQLSLQGAIDIFYMVINAQIVFFMQAGFAMLEVRARGKRARKGFCYSTVRCLAVVLTPALTFARCFSFAGWNNLSQECKVHPLQEPFGHVHSCAHLVALGFRAGWKRGEWAVRGEWYILRGFWS